MKFSSSVLQTTMPGKFDAERCVFPMRSPIWYHFLVEQRTTHLNPRNWCRVLFGEERNNGGKGWSTKYYKGGWVETSEKTAVMSAS